MKKLIKNLNIKYVYFIIFATLIAWAFFAYFTMSKQIHNQEVYAKIINLSGKQRMLSQKITLIAKEYFESKNINLKNHLKELIDLMSKEHSYIINNLTSKTVNDLYLLKEESLDKRIKDYLNLATLFYETENLDLLKKIENTSFELLPSLDKAVSTFQKESDEKSDELLKRERFILFGTLLTLFLEAIFIVIPSLRISAQKEKELKELNESLKIKIRNAVKKNQEKESQIHQQFHLAQMEEMIINLSHQWRQPLSVISTLASSIIIEKELNQISDEELFEKINIIMSKIDYLSNTINNFNELIKSDDILENLNLHKVIDKTLFILEHNLKADNINVNKHFANTDIFIVGNGLKLSHALLSIFNNSKDFLINNQIKNKQIYIKTYTKNNLAYIEIEDTAGGIKEENLKKIFDIYFTTKHQSQGTGIGLYLTYHIIKNYFKGFIEVENVKHGAKFTIKLPLK